MHKGIREEMISERGIAVKPTRVYQCEDSPEGIFTAVYEAGVSGYGHDYIRIQAQSNGLAENLTLFSEYITVEPDPEKMDKVLRSVRNKISVAAYEQIMRAVLSAETDKADAIYHFIVYGFALGPKVTDALQIPCVQRIFEINRRIQNEAHFYLEVLRFQEIKMEHPVLLAAFEPQNEVLTMITGHFADRLNPEWFIIYDKTHQMASFHSPGREWYVRRLEPEEAAGLEGLTQQEEKYTDLWKVFFETIRVEERTNEKLQQNNLPLRYRKYMPEFH